MPFYPTYEEWKLSFLYNISVVSNTFYPTYEEWKHINSNRICFFTFLFILPIRNGNVCPVKDQTSVPVAFYPTYEEWKHYDFATFNVVVFRLFILPMRNGNSLSSLSLSLTSIPFYPTYKEWKRR